MSAALRSVAFTAHRTAELVTQPADEAPMGAGEIGGPTLASLVSPGTELNWAYLGQEFPSYPGYAAVFRVEAMGPDVCGFDVGDLAFCMGPHRSRQRVVARDAVRAPSGLGAAPACLCRLMNVSMSTLTTATARPPQGVLVTGLGIVGHLAAQIFSSCGYQVLAVDPDEPRRALAREKGLEAVFAQTPLKDTDLAGRVALALECSGHEAAAIDCCRMVRQRGEVVLVGVPWRKNTEQSAHELLHAIFHQYAVVRSGWEWEVPRHPAPFVTGSLQENLEAALRWIAEGRVDVSGLYETVSPAECGAVYEGLLDRSWPALSAIYDWAGLSEE